jgi:hypothetical protein
VAVEELDAIAVDGSGIEEGPFFYRLVDETPLVEEFEAAWMDRVCSPGEAGGVCFVCVLSVALVLDYVKRIYR